MPKISTIEVWPSGPFPAYRHGGYSFVRWNRYAGVKAQLAGSLCFPQIARAKVARTAPRFGEPFATLHDERFTV